MVGDFLNTIQCSDFWADELNFIADLHLFLRKAGAEIHTNGSELRKGFLVIRIAEFSTGLSHSSFIIAERNGCYAAGETGFPSLIVAYAFSDFKFL